MNAPSRKARIALAIAALAYGMGATLYMTGCTSAQLASESAALQKFNAAAVPRLEQDAQVAIGGATGAVAAQLAASLEGNGTIDPSVLGSAAGVGALTALVKLDISRARGTAQRARLNTWLVAVSKHRVKPVDYLAYRKLRVLYVGNDEVKPLVFRP